MTAETDSVSNPEKSATTSSAEQVREKLSQEATKSDGSKKRQIAAADDTSSPHLGTVELKNEDGSIVTSGSKSKPVTVDQAQALADAVAVHKAANTDYLLYRTDDKDRINKILQCKSDDERKAIKEQYSKKYGIELEDEIRKFEKGSDLATFQNIFERQDSNIENQNARRIHEDLVEMHDIGGRSRSEIDKDIRAALSTHSSDQLIKMNHEYQSMYGTGLSDAVSQDAKVSQTSKDFANILLTGKHDDQSTKQLIDIALRAKDVDCFQEAMRDASDSVRQDFMRDGGDKKIQDAFGQSTFGKLMDFALGGPIAGSLIYSHYNRTAKQATDYASKGKLDTSTQVTENTGAASIFDNKDGIELALKRMTDEERKQYFVGKELDKSQKTQLSSEESAAKAAYQKLHDALNHAVNPTQTVKYEDMIANNGQSSFVGSLARHRGTVLNDSTAAIAKDINGISQKDWTDCKTHPERRQALKEMLSTLNKSSQDVARLLKQYDTVIDAKSHEQISQPKSISEQLDALPRQFVSMGDSGELLADTADTVAMVQKAFNADPALRDRLTHPQTADEQIKSDAFKKSLQNAMGSGYELFGKPLAESGHIPLALRMNLTRDGFGRDKQKALDFVAEASQEERQRLNSDSKYRQEVLGDFDNDTQKIALKVAGQGSFQSEDKIRLAVTGSGGSSTILNELKSMPLEQINSARSSYCKNYGSSFDNDVMTKLSGNDRETANQILTQNLNVETRANIAAVDTARARSGFGAWFSDEIARSGTGPQADDARSQTNRILTQDNTLQQSIRDASALTANLTIEQKQHIQEQLQTYLTQAIDFQNQATENHIDSKKKAGDYVGDVGIATAAIASMIITGGADTPLVIGLLASGAVIKVGTNAVMQGDNYDYSLRNIAKDGTIGAVMAGTSLIGPAQLAALFNIGESAAKESAMLTITSLTRLGVQDTLTEGGEQILETGAKKIIQNTLSTGASKLDANAIVKLAESAVAPEVTGAARTQAVAMISAQLRDHLSERMATGVVRYAVAQSLNAGGAGVGGGTSGFVNGVLNWDSSKTVSKNLENIAQLTGTTALTSAITGAAVSGATIAVKSNLPSIRRTSAPENSAPATSAPETGEHGTETQGTSAPENAPKEVIPSEVTATAPGGEAATEGLPKTSSQPEETFEPEVRGHSIERGDNQASTTPPRAELSVPVLTDTEIGTNLREQIKDVTKAWQSADALTDAELEARRLQLEAAINDFQDKQNLPGIKLAIDDDIKSGGGAYGDGVIRVSDKDISKPGEALNVTLGHELTHAEQDYLKICQAADRLNIGKVPTNEEALKLAEELKTLDDDFENNNYALLPFAKDALAKRNGIPLNAAENLRADLLSKAANSYSRGDGRWDLLRDHLESLQQKTALEEAEKLDLYQSSPVMSANLQKLLGTETPSPEVQDLIDKARAIKDGIKPKSAWNEHDAQGILSRIYRAEILKTQDEQTRAWQEYQDNLLEKEARASERNLRDPHDSADEMFKLFRRLKISF